MSDLRVMAPAKINWTLEVLGPRRDGFHEVRTVLQTIDLCDEVRLAPAEALSLSVEGPHEAREDDLALRAAALLAEAAGRAPSASIRLAKRIPAAAGLGGGSSDAAAVLRGLDRLWGPGLGHERLAELAATLGSDVPFFVYGGTALAEGRGERVTPLPDVPPVWLIVLVPPFTLPEKTRRLYQALTAADFSDGARTAALARRIEAGEAIDGECLHNAFEPAAFATFPELGAYRDALLAAGARRVRVAGSGPALFVVAPTEAEARALHERLRAPGGVAFAARTLTAAEAVAVEE
ncbi:MAG TPA: 4-(cytidine 5'-diphospho)-2-C-methyl-D-erythritol kinase [Dehalococcoidia bacterium]|nr:4-(cytidine 5'-diphospho)-2-C-methyl-D-erythritol kinase [Dehalococcoidia bacterium]